jgi:hypothetical protein
MKKLIFSAMLMAFAVAVQAGDSKCCADKEQAGCCSKAKATEQTSLECPMAKQTKNTSTTAPKSAAKETSAKPVLASPKAAADLAAK